MADSNVSELPAAKTDIMTWINNNDTLTTVIVVVLLVAVLACCARTICVQLSASSSNSNGPNSNLNIRVGEGLSGAQDAGTFDETPIHKPPVSSPVPETVKMPQFESLVPPPSPPPVYQTPEMPLNQSIKGRDRRAVRSVGSATRGSSFLARVRKSFRRRGSQANANTLEAAQQSSVCLSSKQTTSSPRDDNDNVFQ